MSQQLRYNYVYPIGYVKDVVSIVSGLILNPFLYGVSPENPPTDIEVNLGTETSIKNIAQTFTFPEPDNEYLWVALPIVVGRTETFEINDFPVSFEKERRRILINGIPYIYELHTSRYRQNGTGIQASIVT